MASVRAVIQHEHRILLLRRTARSTRALQWSLPGGRIEADESAASACLREIREETGLNVAIVRSLLRTAEQEFFLCTTDRDCIELRIEENDEYIWADPGSMLSIGSIMDLKLLTQALQIAGIEHERPVSF